MNPKFNALAYREYRDYAVYSKLLETETNPAFRHILERMARHQRQHYQFWRTLSGKKDSYVPRYIVTLFLWMRKLLGLTFTLRFLENEEKHAITFYEHLLQDAHGELKEHIQAMIEDEALHEKALIQEIKEDKIAFIGNLILGLNDGLIEMIGALVGFSFAFTNHRLIPASGLISGIAAGVSMASAAYLQARHEKEKEKSATKAALYTGISYLVIVALLVIPFFVTSSTTYALISMFIIALCIILSISYYTAIIFERNFSGQLREMLFFSIGASLISFVIGSLLQSFLI